MVPSLPLLSCKSSVSVKKTLIKKMYKGQHLQKATSEAWNRCVLIKIFKTIYFAIKKNWAVRENWMHHSILAKWYWWCRYLCAPQGLQLLCYRHLSSFRKPVLKCLYEKLDKEICSRIIATGDYSFLTEKTTDMADWAALSILRYVNSDTQSEGGILKGLVKQIVKGGELCVKKICDVLHLMDKIKQLCFHGLDDFIHLIPKFQSLKVVDVNILAVWKTIKYPSVKACIFREAQHIQGLKNMKLFTAATTTWLWWK